MQSSIKLFGKRIKEIRKRKHFTQEKLAEILGVDDQTISRIETGHYFTSYENLEKIAQTLGVDVKDLFEFNHLQDRDSLKKQIVDYIENLPLKDLQKISKFILEFL